MPRTRRSSAATRISASSTSTATTTRPRPSTRSCNTWRIRSSATRPSIKARRVAASRLPTARTRRSAEGTTRLPPHPARRTEKAPPTPHRDITLMRRWMDAMGVDIACMFPTPMLNLAACPRVGGGGGVGQGYNRWLCEKILGEEDRFKSMLYLPFNDPEACYKTVLEFADRKGVIGFMVTATHYRGVYDNAYAKTYAALQERGLPLAFHAAFNWADSGLSMTNRFIAVHALGFTWHNMLHLTNWVVNGMPERFPGLKTIWIESGLAWVPFLMQRLDNEYMMRTSDCALLKKKPSDYMRDMYFTSQPMEMVDNREALQLTFKMINSEPQLLYSSASPHWARARPSRLPDLPFLSEQAKRNILGDNARRLFNLEPVLSETKQLRKASRTQQQPEINKVFGVASAAE